MESLALLCGHLAGDYLVQNDRMAASKTSNSWVCLLHCAAYAWMVWCCCFWFLAFWQVVVVGLVHFPIDRWRLARKFMDWNGQTEFATGPLAPWSVIVVDNTFHLLTLFFVAAIGRLPT